jgi:coenzyme F420-reducing hydrogenase delta subunit
LLSQIGLEPERVQMYNMSSAMASQFVEATKDMTKTIMELGNNPLRTSHP